MTQPIELHEDDRWTIVHAGSHVPVRGGAYTSTMTSLKLAFDALNTLTSARIRFDQSARIMWEDE